MSDLETSLRLGSFWGLGTPMLQAAAILQSTLTCPLCGMARMETMPTDACQYFYPCTGCGVVLRPKPGDCCVFCSYATVACPPRQPDGRATRDAPTGGAEPAAFTGDPI
jgi:hypothetical protein